MSWSFKDKHLVLRLIPDVNDRRHKLLIVWGKNGTDQDRDYCIDQLSQFITSYGGPHGQEQWQADGIHNVNKEIWVAAERLWGYPVFQEEFPSTWISRLARVGSWMVSCFGLRSAR